MSMLNPFKIFSDIRRLQKKAHGLQEILTTPCAVCGATATHLDTLDFNKSCEEIRGALLQRTGVGVDYFLCDQCGYCFAPEFGYWSFEDFEKYIYNADYELIDPDYKFIRPKSNAAFLDEKFGPARKKIKHLDYGGGSGLLSKTLQEKGWTSISYDPFVDSELKLEELGQFDLVTAYEVFEHVPDSTGLINTLKKLCKPNGIILFTTLISDGNIARGQKLDWWYAAPRNGHISLFSQKSLNMLISQGGWDGLSFSSVLHAAFREVPAWAGTMIRKI
jgi:SAM-dependent methyltransferase